jgi:signal peptidase I, bacterial type
MENTLLAGQKLIMDKISYNFSQPKRGDIIIFLEFKHKSSVKDEISIFLTDFENVLNLSTGNDRLVKRVIGVPGDTIDIKDGHVFVNNEMLEENYIKGETLKRETTFPIKVPEGKLFVLGDNRAVSRDSRNFGLVDSDQVEGKAVFRVWPYNKLGTVK